MNKKLLTLAIGATMVAAPFVSVQAAPTVYGQIHVSVESLDDDTGLANDSNISQSSNSSRLGFKGSESLSGGMSAFYQAEWQVQAGTAGNNLNQRNQFAGIKGDFGSVLVGRHDTPMKKIGRSVDLFWSAQAGESRNLVHQGAWDSRFGNTIMYTSPSVNGLQGKLAYITDAADAVGTDDNDNDATSLSVTYKNGPIYVGLGYEVQNQNGTVAAAADEHDDTNALRLVGSYKMNNMKFVGFYQTVENEDFGATDDADSEDRDTWGIGAAYKMGMTTFKGQYYVADSRDDATGVNEDGASMISLGVDHSLSANTTVYAVYAATDNDTLGAFSVNGNGHDDRVNNVPGAGAGPSNADPSVFGVGLRVKF